MQQRKELTCNIRLGPLCNPLHANFHEFLDLNVFMGTLIDREICMFVRQIHGRVFWRSDTESAFNLRLEVFFKKNLRF